MRISLNNYQSYKCYMGPNDVKVNRIDEVNFYMIEPMSVKEFRIFLEKKKIRLKYQAFLMKRHSVYSN